MCDSSDLILGKYKEYLTKLAESQSEEIFYNAGKEHASVLMAIMLDNTKQTARIFSEGFKADLITTEPYFGKLKQFLEKKDIKLSVLIENDDHITEKPVSLLKKYYNEGSDIALKKIKEEDKNEIFEKLNSKHCNFAVFDDNKFRLEYIPEEYKAMGSFNQPNKCNVLINLFDNAFNRADAIALS